MTELSVGRDDQQTLGHSFNDVSKPAWKNVSELAYQI